MHIERVSGAGKTCVTRTPGLALIGLIDGLSITIHPFADRSQNLHRFLQSCTSPESVSMKTAAGTPSGWRSAETRTLESMTTRIIDPIWA